MRTFTTLDEVAAAAGSEIGTSEWLDVDQARIDAFADATLDHQWIHVDVDPAAKGPFGTTIAHGFLTLSMLTHLRFGEVRDLAAGKQLVVEHTVEIEGHDKPACVAAHVVLLLA